MPSQTTIKPSFHHFNLKTTRLQELIDWYTAVVGAEVTFQDAMGAWLTNDAANHRIALLAFPGFVDDPDRETRTGMHHSAFEYEDFQALNSSYLRLREAAIEPDICIDHGMTLSYYYRDPDGNRVELQVDAFGDWQASKHWMQSSPEFKANPIGVLSIRPGSRMPPPPGRPSSRSTVGRWRASSARRSRPSRSRARAERCAWSATKATSR